MGFMGSSFTRILLPSEFICLYLEVLHRGAGELAWSTRYAVHDGLYWDDERQVWAGPDAFPYDGARLFGYSRGGEVGGAA
jgi:hypothetical protein